MIKIRVSNGVPYIWDPRDWLSLRKEHRIIGTLDGAELPGCSGRGKWGLPMRLSNVEVQYLVGQGIAETVYAPSLLDNDPVLDPKLVEITKADRNQNQLDTYRQKRKEELERYADKVLEGKRRKGRVSDTMDRNTYIQNELDKITKLPYELYHLELRDPWVTEDDYVPYGFQMPSSYVDKLKYKVFEDFHLRKKYWLTCGAKFGGDFLAYPGDPRDYHAEFIIQCPEKDAQLRITEYIRTHQCRLALTVKKTLLVATFDEETDKLKYYVPSIEPSLPKE